VQLVVYRIWKTSARILHWQRGVATPTLHSMQLEISLLQDDNAWLYEHVGHLLGEGAGGWRLGTEGAAAASGHGW
jgi:hypothetical protein